MSVKTKKRGNASLFLNRIYIILPAFDIQNTAGGADDSGDTPDDQGSIPAEGIGDQRQTVGGQGTAHIGAGIEDARDQRDLAGVLKELGHRADEDLIDAVHTACAHRQHSHRQGKGAAA